MFFKQEEENYTELIEGIQINTMVHGEKTLMAKFRLKKGSSLPLHSHPHEQTGYLISGKMSFVVDGTTTIAEPGDSWTILGGIEHGAEVLEDSVAIEVFSPMREEYLPKNLKA